MILLLDNTVLSNFALAERMELLPQALAGNASTTPQVMKEFETGVALGRLPGIDLGWLEVVTLRAEEDALFEEHLARVNTGEAACLAVAARSIHAGCVACWKAHPSAHPALRFLI